MLCGLTQFRTIGEVGAVEAGQTVDICGVVENVDNWQVGTRGRGEEGGRREDQQSLEPPPLPLSSSSLLLLTPTPPHPHSSYSSLLLIPPPHPPLQTITKKNGEETRKRSITLRDRSGGSIELTLWGQYASDPGDSLHTSFQTGDRPIVAIKGARVGDFNGACFVACFMMLCMRLCARFV
jgi:hypothetical protein